MQKWKHWFPRSSDSAETVMSWLQKFLLLSIWPIKKIKEKDPDQNICQNILNSLYMPLEIKNGALKEQMWKRKSRKQGGRRGGGEMCGQMAKVMPGWRGHDGQRLVGMFRVCVCVCSWMKHHIPSPHLLKHPFFSLSGPFPTLILTSYDSLMSNPLLGSVVSFLAKDYLVMNKLISSSCIWLTGRWV